LGVFIGRSLLIAVEGVWVVRGEWVCGGSPETNKERISQISNVMVVCVGGLGRKWTEWSFTKSTNNYLKIPRIRSIFSVFVSTTTRVPYYREWLLKEQKVYCIPHGELFSFLSQII
jgi:hypothetical protein